MDSNRDRLDLATIRNRLAGLEGRRFWRSLEELAETEEFQEFLQREFPRQAAAQEGLLDRRQFLQLMGASLALAGLAACTPHPAEKIVPYVEPPEEIIPGLPLFFATAMTLGGFASGVLATSHMGRPTKLEGNPDHPASLGATDIYTQASILTLYDPDRAQVITRAGQISTWQAFLTAMQTEMETLRARQGAGLRVLTETVTSPTLATQIQNLLEELPQARWHQYEPVTRDHVRAGAHMAFGEEVHTHYRFDQADVVLALDADFLSPGPGSVRYTRDFVDGRRVREGQTQMNRLYVVESTSTITGAMADHRLPLRPSQVEVFARALGHELGILDEPPPITTDGDFPASAFAPQTNEKHAAWLRAVVDDLQHNQGASVVLAGPEQSPAVHALVHAINDALGNVGATVIYTEPVEPEPVDQLASLRELVQDMAAGDVDVLIILEGNPVFNAPADLEFAQHLAHVRQRIHLGLYEDETSAHCQWHIPATHYLETWGDARAYDGTVTIMQPLIAPLYDGKSAHDLLMLLLGRPDRTSYEVVREHWEERHGSEGFERFWRTAVHDGLIADSDAPAKEVTLQLADEVLRPGAVSEVTTENLEVAFRPDPTIWDGRFANNGWLQELPKPLTKLTWDNAALISPATAERLGLSSEDVVFLNYQSRSEPAPIWILPGQPDGVVTVHFGNGRTRAGRVGSGVGFNAYRLRSSQAPWFDDGLQLQTTTHRYELVSTQHHYSMEGRHLVRAGAIGEFRADPHFAHAEVHDPPPHLTMYPLHPYEGHAWGMSIDLNACIGCNACTIACQAENNIPIVGKEEVARGREMHWIRVDRYYEGGLDDPQVHHQPVPCMHCELAPCEPVCPVAATVHSSEGLNEQVYNRCVGTRYCANNCPYKVRRFNFFEYADHETPVLKLLRNPNVTVRSVGVMEKCTYCVQRINFARREAKKENRPVRDGEIETACEGACPAQAIVFGDINDPESRVSQLKAEPLDYSLLGELNTRPRTTYMAKLKNPHPDLLPFEEYRIH